MYAIISLDPASALAYRSLAPFELRDVIADLGSLARVRAFGAHLFGRPVGLAMVAIDSPLSATLAPDVPAPTARLLALTVARSHRRLGLGRSLLKKARQSLEDSGVRQLACSYSFDTPEGTEAAEAFFAATGWGRPETTMVHCAADQAFMSAPLLKDVPPLPDEYEVCDWVDLTPQDRASIADRQRRDPWYPPALDPFHFEAELEVVNSLALRYRGEVVGWLLTHRTSPKTMYYRCLFVRDDLARLGRGITLLVEAVNRHWEAIGHQPGLGEWSTPASLPRMVRFIRRHLQPFGARVRDQKRTRAPLDPSTSAANVAADPNDGQRIAVQSVPFLRDNEAERIRQLVLDARERWRPREEPLPFHTLGATARLDARDNVREYMQRALHDNPILDRQFGWLYERLLSALTAALGAPATFTELGALPGFRIAHPQRGDALPIAPIHCDTMHVAFTAGALQSVPCVSFALSVTSPEHANGVTLWSLTHADTIGLDSEETAKLLDADPRREVCFEANGLLFRPGDTYHQRLPLAHGDPGTPQITLEGHAFLHEGAWRVYW